MADDDLAAAEIQKNLFQDPRVAHYWHPEKSLGEAAAQTLGLKNTPIAWDVYLLYRPGSPAKISGFPAPDFWMHQLPEDESLRLDPEKLQQQVEAALDDVERRVRIGA